MNHLLKDYKLAGLKIPVFIILAIVIVICSLMGALPTGMIGGFLFLIAAGELLNLIGNKLPIVRTYLGGGAIVCIFGGSALVYFHLLPEAIVKNSTTFMKGGGFLDFYIAALIAGSILGMNRKLLIRAFVKYIPCILGAVILSLVFVSLGSYAFGMSPREAMAYIGIPIMGGGLGAGAVPISNIFGEALHQESTSILSRLIPAVALGNAMAIVAGGLLDRLGKAVPKLTGNGNLVRVNDPTLLQSKQEPAQLKNLSDYSAGILAATGFFAFGAIFSKILSYWKIPIHTYAFMIIAVALCKGFNILPRYIEEASEVWYNFVAKNFTAALMLGIGVAYTDLGDIIRAFTGPYLVLVFLVVIGAILGAGLIGRLIGFYPIEAAITAGLCMANMGGTGDVAVLTASKRMELMPFAQISSRLGGALMLLLAAFLVPLFF